MVVTSEVKEKRRMWGRNNEEELSYDLPFVDSYNLWTTRTSRMLVGVKDRTIQRKIKFQKWIWAIT